MKKILLLSLLAVLVTAPNLLTAQDLSAKKIIPGSWLGKLTTDEMELRVIFNLKLIGKDSLNATIDSPDQGAKDIPCGQVTLEKQKLVIMAPSINGEYEGTITSDSTINGTWSQNGGTLPLNLKKQGKLK
jgi:hypothetical protein